MNVSHSPHGKTRSFRVISAGVAGWVRNVKYSIDSIPEENERRIQKSIRDGNFRQEDILRITRDGKAYWHEKGAEQSFVYTIPPDVTDYVSLLHELRGGPPLRTGEQRNIVLALDAGLHPLTIRAVRSETLRINGQSFQATLHEIDTASEILFSRNFPRSIWISEHNPLILRMEIQSRHGRINADLVTWEENGAPVDWSRLQSPPYTAE